MPDITLIAMVGNAPMNGIVCSAYKASRFGSLPVAYDTAVPGGAADATATSGSAFGGPGQVSLTVPTFEEYWVAVPSGGHIGWVKSPSPLVPESDVTALLADLAGMVHLAGAETITGIKSFNAAVVAPANNAGVSGLNVSPTFDDNSKTNIQHFGALVSASSVGGGAGANHAAIFAAATTIGSSFDNTLEAIDAVAIYNSSDVSGADKSVYGIRTQAQHIGTGSVSHLLGWKVNAPIMSGGGTAQVVFGGYIADMRTNFTNPASSGLHFEGPNRDSGITFAGTRGASLDARFYSAGVGLLAMELAGITFGDAGDASVNAFQKVRIGGTVPAATGTAIGAYIDPTLVASANSDVLSALHLYPAFNDNGKSGISHLLINSPVFSVDSAGNLTAANVGTFTNVRIGGNLGPSTGATPLNLNYNAGNGSTAFYNGGSTLIASIDSTGLGTFNGGLAVADAKNIALATTTGTKIGTDVAQKLAFHNSTPVIQRAGAAQVAAATTAATNTTPYGFTTAAQANAIVILVNELRAAAVEKGLIKGAA